jgi:hypothetical protein
MGETCAVEMLHEQNQSSTVTGDGEYHREGEASELLN